MARAALRIVLTEDERETLTAWSRTSSGEHRLVERSRVILLAAEGFSAREIARRLKTRLARVSKWRQRFGQQRLAGLDDAPRTGKPRTYNQQTEKQILALLDGDPPAGYSQWNGRLLADAPGACPSIRGAESTSTSESVRFDQQEIGNGSCIAGRAPSGCFGRPEADRPTSR